MRRSGWTFPRRAVLIPAVDSNAAILEILIRGGAAGAFIGTGLVMARRPMTPARLTGLLFCLAAAAHTLTQYPPIARALGPALPLVWAFSAMGAGLFWAFTTELFGDRPTLRPRRFGPALLLLAIGVAAALAPDGAAALLWLAHNLVGAALMAHVLAVIGAGWRNDLVESRRRLRGPVLLAGAAYALAVTAVQASEILWRPASALSPLAAATLLLLGLASVAVLLRADPDLFAPMSPPAARIAAPSATPGLSDEAARLAQGLDRLMRVERIYREPGLSVAGLALRLRVPEHRLRRLINQQLGHRSFNAFLNEWRLGDARQALADPAEREVPISTVALDAGFQSLGPFNRAFKAATGLTPSAFRAQALATQPRLDP